MSIFFPIEPPHRADTRLFRFVDHCLKIGGAVALFPEADFGPREGELLPFEKEFARFVVDSGVPVVPIALSGTKDLWLGKAIGLRIGNPIPSQGRRWRRCCGVVSRRWRSFCPRAARMEAAASLADRPILRRPPRPLSLVRLVAQVGAQPVIHFLPGFSATSPLRGTAPWKLQVAGPATAGRS